MRNQVQSSHYWRGRHGVPADDGIRVPDQRQKPANTSTAPAGCTASTYRLPIAPGSASDDRGPLFRSVSRCERINSAQRVGREGPGVALPRTAVGHAPMVPDSTCAVVFINVIDRHIFLGDTWHRALWLHVLISTWMGPHSLFRRCSMSTPAEQHHGPSCDTVLPGMVPGLLHRAGHPACTQLVLCRKPWHFAFAHIPAVRVGVRVALLFKRQAL